MTTGSSSSGVRPASSPGRLYGVGLGPGDPELVTVKAARLVGAADVIAYHSARHGRSIARALAAPYLRTGADAPVEEQLVYPVTTEETDHPGGYSGALDAFYADVAGRLATHLDAGRTVVVLAEGDPFFYGSYMHVHTRLAHRYPTEVVPGVTSMTAAAAALGRPLVERDEVLTVLPGTLPADVLARRLADTDAAVVMKLGRTFEQVRAGLESSGRLAEAQYVERATWPQQRTGPLADVEPSEVPYFSLAVVPSPAVTARTQAGTGEAEATGGAGGPGQVVVVGTGPAGRDWLTPEVAAALAGADDLVGYGPYLARVPANPRQRRHASDNRVEAERAAHALELARSGRRVAVVSSGDPGVFAMATAVLEVACEDRFAAVPVRVLPGLTAAQAVASRVGAPLGHDYATISLSDRLKPWEVVEQRLDAAAGADLVLALYNPRSAARPWQVGAARDVLLRHRSPDTPVVLGRDVGGDGEQVRVITLGELVPEDVDMRTCVLVGSSRTRRTNRADGSPVVFTPRHYPG